jgi:hypothetical protein
MGVLYPNLYVLLVAPPGVGKTEAIKRVGDLWHATESLHVAPDAVTKAAMIDALARANVKLNVRDANGTMQFEIFHGLNIAADEFGVLCPAYDLAFLSVLSKLYDNGPSFKEELRSRKGEDQINIKAPILNILAGTQPGFMGQLLPEAAWSQGITSRLLMVYSGVGIKQQLSFGKSNSLNREAKKEYDRMFGLLRDDLKTVAGLYGEVDWDAEATEALTKWYDQNLEPIPTHTRLQHYCTRRLATIFKLAMVSSASRRNDLMVAHEDLIRAQDWLLEAEGKMPDVFREMTGSSDKAIIDDLHQYMWQMFARTKTAMTEQDLLQFLASKAPTEKVFRLMELCERAGIIEREPNSLERRWRPGRGQHIRGVE